MTRINRSFVRQWRYSALWNSKTVCWTLFVTVSLVLVACSNPFKKDSAGKSTEATRQVTEVAPVTPHAQAEPATVEKCSIAVLDFTIHTSNVPAFHRQFDTNLLTDKLITALAGTRKFRVVERERVDKLLKEFKLSNQGFTSRQSAVNAGNMLGADYLVLGSISNMSVGVHTEDIPYTTQHTTAVTGHLSSDIRVVDSRTGEIVAAWKEDLTRRGTSNSGVNVNDMYGHIERDLADRLAVKIIEAVYPIKVASIGPDKTLYLNRGTGSGLNVGDRLEVYKPGKPIIDPDTHEILGGQDTLIGIAEVTDVQARISLAKILQSTAPIAVGAIMKHPRQKKANHHSSGHQAAEPKLNW